MLVSVVLLVLPTTVVFAFWPGFIGLPLSHGEARASTRWSRARGVFPWKTCGDVTHATTFGPPNPTGS